MIHYQNMIKKIKFDNFYSFKEEQILDFTVSKKKSSDYYQSYDGKQISKIAGFIGSNASGKTNIMKLLGYFKYIITVSQRNSDINDTAFKSYAFSKAEDSNFSIEFETENNIFLYKLTINPDKIIKEELKTKSLIKKSKLINVFSRNLDSIKINKKLIKGVTLKNIKSVRGDVSLISFINANYNESVINEVYEYFNHHHTVNINETGSMHSADAQLDPTSFLYFKYPKIQKQMEDFIKDFNIGINKFNIKHLPDNKIEINSSHMVQNKEYELPITYESHGTKTLFVELPYILSFIDTGYVLIIDEIESGLHPEAVDKIIQYISDSLKNTKKQFIFSSNSLNFLKKFDAQQIFLIEKIDNKSEVFRLDELNIRPDENFFSKYTTGAYGAFPNIKI